MDLLETESPATFIESPIKGYDAYYVNGGLLELGEYKKAAQIVASGESSTLTDQDIPYNDTTLHQALNTVKRAGITITKAEAAAYKYLRNQKPPLEELTKEERQIHAVQTPPAGLNDQELLEAVFSMSNPAKLEAFDTYRKDVDGLELRQADIGKDIIRPRHI